MNAKCKDQKATKEDNENYSIYIKELNRWEPVSKEVFEWNRKDIRNYIRRMKRNNLCSCVSNNWWMCDKDCCTCSHRHGSEFSSIDSWFDNTDSNGKSIAECISVEGPSTQEIAEDHDLVTQLRVSICSLPPRQKNVCELLLKGLTEMEIARVLGIDQTTVGYNYRQAVKELRLRLIDFT